MNILAAQRRIAAKAGNAVTIWIASIAGFLVIAGLLFFLLPQVSVSSNGGASSRLLVGKPLHTLTFEDGSSLQILNIGDGSVVDGDMSAKPASSLFSSQSSGSSTSGMSGNGVGCKLKTVTINDHITGIQFDSPPTNLVIEARLLNFRGDPLRCERLLWGDEIRAKGSSDSLFPGWDALLKAPENDSTMPELVVQLSDGAGGWINGHGPYSSEKDREQRGMIVFAAWPRSGAELEFRAARAGGKPVTWKMKNPSHAAAPAAWTASPLPQKQSDTDYELELQSVVKIDGVRILQPKVSFLSKVPGEGQQLDYNNQPLPGLECTCAELLGAWGTRAEKVYLSRPGNYVVSGFPYPPDEKILRLRFVISPTQAYPYPRSQALLIAKAKVAANGISLESAPQILTANGILSIEFHDVTTGPKGSYKYSIKGRWNNDHERMAGEAAIGDNDRIPVCYVGEALLSSSVADTNAHNISNSGKVTEFEYEGDWKGPLKPGDEITLGMTTALPIREVLFTFEP